MNRAARSLAISSVAAVFTLAPALPTAMAQDSYSEGDQVAYPTGYDWYGRGEHRRGDRHRHGAPARSEGDRGSARRPAGPPGDPGASPGRGHRASAGNGSDDAGNHSADATPGNQNVSREELRARERAAERIRRAGVEMARLQEQQMMVVHLERADAYLVSMAERIRWSDLDPAPKHALLDMIDSRRTRIADLVEQVRAAETAQQLQALRPATLDPVGASQG